VYNEDSFWIKNVKARQGNHAALDICSSEHAWLHEEQSLDAGAATDAVCGAGWHSHERSGTALQPAPPGLRLTQRCCLDVAAPLSLCSDLPISILE